MIIKIQDHIINTERIAHISEVFERQQSSYDVSGKKEAFYASFTIYFEKDYYLTLTFFQKGLLRGEKLSQKFMEEVRGLRDQVLALGEPIKTISSELTQTKYEH